MTEGLKRILKYHALVNPSAKSGQGRAIWERVEAELKKRDVPYEAVFSKSSEHIRQAVDKLTAHRGVRLIVIGGDGTLNQVVDGIRDFDHVRLGYIPAGSANDFARSLALPDNPLALLDTILKDEVTRRLDVGVLTYQSYELPEKPLIETAPKFAETRKFIVSAGIGFDAAVCAGVLTMKSRKLLSALRLSKIAYLLVALKLIVGHKNVACDLTLDDEKQIHLNSSMFTAAMIHRFEGGGFMFAPDADASDGLFDLCVIGDISRGKFLRGLPLAYKGRHFDIDGCDHYFAKKLEIRAAKPLWAHTDGEVLAKTDHATFVCEPQALKLLM